jgi:hypothetical protein
MAQRPLGTVTDSTHLCAAPIGSVADALVRGMGTVSVPLFSPALD